MNRKITTLQSLLANRKLRSALLIGCLFFGVNAMAQSTYYVKSEATGTGDGTSWGNAGSDLQLAINTAAAGDAVWVAGGTYKPNRKATDLTIVVANDPDNAFVLKEGVQLYGGFAGTETALTDRDLTITANASTLSGDFNGDDLATGEGAGLTLTNNTENATHVVLALGGGTDAPLTTATVIDGFTITGGNATLSFGSITVNGQSVSKFTGAGMLNFNYSSPTVANVTFIGNAASYGGGMYNKTNSSPALSVVEIHGNTATVGGGIANWTNSAPTLNNVDISANAATAGGGMYNYDGAAPVLTNVSIIQNYAITGSGGGMFNNSSAPSLTDVTISQNTALADGGGIYSTASAAPVLNNVIITTNTAVNGGGMYNDDSAAPVITGGTISANTATSGGGMYNSDSAPIILGVTFEDNTAVNNGGAICNFTNAPAAITNTIINGNSAENGGGVFNNDHSLAQLTNVKITGNAATTGFGGGIYNKMNSSSVITSCLIAGNTAGTSGGGIFNNDNSSPVLTNVTITSNSAVSQGGGVCNNASNPVFRNSILYGNTDTTGVNTFNFNESVPIYYNSLVEFSSSSWDALGVDGGNNIDADPMFLGVTFTFQEASPAINAGSNTYFNEGQTPDLSGVTTDLAGNDRIYDDVVDLGAYEFQGVLGVANPAHNTKLSYYPNPVTNLLTITSAVAISNVTVYNMLGQQVLNGQFNAVSGQINMETLKAGNYIVKITAKNTSSFMVIKE